MVLLLLCKGADLKLYTINLVKKKTIKSNFSYKYFIFND